MAGTIPLMTVTVIGAALVLMNAPRHFDFTAWAVTAIQALALVATIAGFLIRRITRILFWPVWLTSLTVILFLVWLTFFFHVF